MGQNTSTWKKKTLDRPAIREISSLKFRYRDNPGICLGTDHDQYCPLLFYATH